MQIRFRIEPVGQIVWPAGEFDINYFVLVQPFGHNGHRRTYFVSHYVTKRENCWFDL